MLSVFPPDRFVDPRFSIAIDEGLNVSRFNASAAQILLRAVFQSRPNEKQEWWIVFGSTYLDRVRTNGVRVREHFHVSPRTYRHSILIHLSPKCNTDGVIANGRFGI